MVAREIISDYYDQRVAPYKDLIPQSGSIIGNVSVPGEFSEADLRGSAPRRSHGGARNLASGSSDGSIGKRIDDGGTSLGQRLDANTQRYGQRRREFDEDQRSPDGSEERFDRRFYDRDQR